MTVLDVRLLERHRRRGVHEDVEGDARGVRVEHDALDAHRLDDLEAERPDRELVRPRPQRAREADVALHAAVQHAPVAVHHVRVRVQAQPAEGVRPLAVEREPVPVVEVRVGGRRDVERRDRLVERVVVERVQAHAATSTGTPFRATVPERGSRNRSSVRSFALAPGSAAATASRAPGRPCPHPCGTETTPGITSSLTSTSSSTSPTRERTRSAAAVHEPEPRGVVGVDEQGAAPLPAREGGQVVEPGVERAVLAAADQQERRRGLGERRVEALRLAEQQRVAELDRPARRAERIRQPRLERAEVDPVRLRLEPRERQPVRPRAEAVAVRAAAEHQVEHPLLPPPGLEQPEQLVGIASRDRRPRVARPPSERLEREAAVELVDVGLRSMPRDDPGQADDRLPLVRHPLRRGRTGGE